MSRLNWDVTGERRFESGVSKGVLYPINNSGVYTPGVAWNGLTGVTDSPSGAELTDLWADGIQYASLRSSEKYGATIESYTYPDEFAECDGSSEPVTGLYLGQQKRKTFGFCYRTEIGNDQDGLENSANYKLHLIYGATASPSEKAYATINDSPDAITMSWEIATTPVTVTGYKPTAHLTIDSTKVDAAKLAALEAILYGVDAVEASGTQGETGYVAAVAAVIPRLPLPAEVISTLT